MLPDPDASLVFDPPGPILLSVFLGVQGTRGEAQPLTPWGSHCLPDPRISYLLWGLGSGYTAQTGPFVAGNAAASSMSSR